MLLESRPNLSKSELAAMLESGGFVKAAPRIGLAVYRNKGGRKRSTLELAVGATMVHEYDLSDGRRRLARSWNLI